MPVVTISRMYGSGGAEIAEIVARELGWALLDNAIVERVAVGLRLTPHDVAALEERVPTLAERIADAFAFGSQEMLAAPLGAPLPPTESRILEVTQRVIEDALARGPAVLVGRGAQARLASRDDAMHVFCVASRDTCVARVMAREGVSAAEAASLVEETNRRRAEYVKRHWGREWRNASSYDLCVNTGWLGVPRSAALVLQLAKEKLGAG